MQLVTFEPNQPQKLCLGRDTEPCTLPNGAGCLYTLSDGRLLHLAPAVILHQRGAELPFWSVWLSNETEQARAEAEAPELERQLAASIEVARRRRSPDSAGSDRPQLAATGTDGPSAVPAISRKPAIAAVAGRRRGEGQIPYNVAFREIVGLVARELAAAGEQWSDQARQDAVSTLFIAAGKAGWLGVWEREAA